MSYQKKLKLSALTISVCMALTACGHHHHGSAGHAPDPENVTLDNAPAIIKATPFNLTDPEVRDGYVYVSIVDQAGATLDPQGQYDWYWWACGDSDPATGNAFGWNDFPADPGIETEIVKDETSGAMRLTYKIPVNGYGQTCGIPRDANLNKLTGGDDFVKSFSENVKTLAFRINSYTEGTGESVADFRGNPMTLDGARAHFIDQNTLAWLNLNESAARVRLYSSTDPSELLQIAPVEGADEAFAYPNDKRIDFEEGNLTDEQREIVGNFLNDAKVFNVRNAESLNNLPAKDALKGQLVAVAIDKDGNVVDQTRVQTAYAIDDLYGNKAFESQDPLGATVNGTSVTYRVFAPTAGDMQVILFSGDVCYKDAAGVGCRIEKRAPMVMDEQTGIWSATVENGANLTYTYSFNIYHPDGNVIYNEVWASDPYSKAVTRNSELSVAVDLDSDTFKPDSWSDDKSPVPQKTSADIASMAIMETHIRDLTVGHDLDPQVEGKFIAFSDEKIRTALKKLGKGITHMEILPFYDFATVNEDPTQVADLTMSGQEFCNVLGAKGIFVNNENEGACNEDKAWDWLNNSLVPQDAENIIKAASYSLDGDNSTLTLSGDISTSMVNNFLTWFVKDYDSYNWGYDPWHYGVPEGSYSTAPEDPAVRTREARTMIKEIHDAGMNVVMDVVYNHTDGAGMESKSSVLDRLVPWYYNRVDSTSGAYLQNTCCRDSAPEHRMFERLMTDTLTSWAKDYHVDAFRFDLMAYIPLDVMKRTLENVRKNSGNDEIYFFGEGWDAGTGGDRFTQANQLNIAGNGIGTFNDRIRDAIRGSGPFDHGYAQRGTQSFSTGKCTLPNELTPADYSCDPDKTNSSDNGIHPLLWQDIIRISMAGNLKDYSFTSYNDKTVTGATLTKDDGSPAYFGVPVAYGDSPIETINYVSKHDNQTIFDMIIHRAKAGLGNKMLMKMQAISLATVFFGQSPVFDQHGSYALRTKFFENDSFNSGDYSNWTPLYGEFNGNRKDQPNVAFVNYEKDSEDWATVIYNSLLDGSNVTSGYVADTSLMAATYLNMLQERRNSRSLLAMGDAELIKKNVRFLNTGKKQAPGVIAMAAYDETNSSGMIVFINAGNEDSLNNGITLNRYEHITNGHFAVYPGQLWDKGGVFGSDTCSAELNGTELVVKSTPWTICLIKFGPDVTPVAVSDIPSMYLIGSITGWSQDSSQKPLTYDSVTDTWNIDNVTLSATDEFKFKVYPDEWGWSYGTPEGGTLGQLTSNNGSNITGIEGNCSFSVTDNIDDMSFTYNCLQ
jgi:pullulanase-type alpha-1,6-glucosidase